MTKTQAFIALKRMAANVAEAASEAACDETGQMEDGLFEWVNEFLEGKIEDEFYKTLTDDESAACPFLLDCF